MYVSFRYGAFVVFFKLYLFKHILRRFSILVLPLVGVDSRCDEPFASLLWYCSVLIISWSCNYSDYNSLIIIITINVLLRCGDIRRLCLCYRTSTRRDYLFVLVHSYNVRCKIQGCLLYMLIAFCQPVWILLYQIVTIYFSTPFIAILYMYNYKNVLRENILCGVFTE